MNERGREALPPSFELPPDQGWERQLEAAKEGQKGRDDPSATKLSDDISTLADDSQTLAASVLQAGLADNAQRPVLSTASKKVGPDSDRIDKIWVNRAKAVISQTKDDPHTQKKQIDLIKAEYLKSKFSKILKVEEVA